MFHCPKCSGKLVSYRTTVMLEEKKGWKCISCEKFYRTQDLVKAIMTV